MRGQLVASVGLVAVLGCGDPPPSEPSGSASSARAQPSGSGPQAITSRVTLPSASASAAAGPIDPDAPFLRSPPSSHKPDADAVDECTQHGGSYFSCRGAYEGEEDPVVKRYLYRIAQAHAAGVKGYGKVGPPTDMGGLPHAEVPGMCEPARPCDAKTESYGLNDPMSCLALAHAHYDSNPGASKAAHLHACRCGGNKRSFIGYNTSAFICDDAGKPSFLAPDMKADEARAILSCAMCEPKEGPAACKADAERLRASDAELAKHVEQTQVRRCQTASPPSR
jgi:hypothetical protein